MHECMKDAVRMLVGLVEEEGAGWGGGGGWTVGQLEEEEGGGEQCVAVFKSTHTHSNPRRRETVAQPGEMWAHLLFVRQGRQHHLAPRRSLSSLPSKRVSLRLGELFDTEAKTMETLPAGEFRLYQSPKHTCAFQAAAPTPGVLIRAERKVSEQQLKTTEASTCLLQQQMLHLYSLSLLCAPQLHLSGNSYYSTTSKYIY